MHDVIIIGAGIAGLTAANYLEEYGYTPLIIEATSKIGGRVKTDVIGGFRLDRGFQVFLPAYPEAKKLLDYDTLQLKYFKPGAKIMLESGEIETISDPLRDYSALFPTVFSGIGTIKDKIKIFKLKKRLEHKKIDEIFEQRGMSTQKYLRHEGFSEDIIDAFFQPFFRGIFLESLLDTNSNMFEFIFKMFSEHNAAMPALGIAALPEQLKNRLKRTSFRFDERVTHIEGDVVFTSHHNEIKSPLIVIGTEATGIVRQYQPEFNGNFVSTSCIYFSSPKIKNSGQYIYLNATKGALVNNVVVLDHISEEVAPKDKSLISCSIVGLSTLGNEELLPNVKEELKKWFGVQVEQWQHLKTYHIPYALPTQQQVAYDIPLQSLKIKEGIYVCGDYLLNGSLNAAMTTGRLVAEAIAMKYGVKNGV